MQCENRPASATHAPAAFLLIPSNNWQAKAKATATLPSSRLPSTRDGCIALSVKQKKKKKSKRILIPSRWQWQVVAARGFR
jgi:hypothetical protein